MGPRHVAASALVALAVLVTPLVDALATRGSPSRAPAAAYTTRGTVKSFGKDRAYVNVEHEAIPGYMESMTMAFHPRRPEQLAALAPGDVVRFAFTEADGNKRLIDWIEKGK